VQFPASWGEHRASFDCSLRSRSERGQVIADAGGHRAASMCTIVQTAKLNGVNPEAYLRDTLTKIAEGHPISRIDELLPWQIGTKTQV
jgi:hypothetical protein